MNLQGDVVKLINASGTVYASYTYNAYGEILTATGSMADINPLRYRGYYYDTETGFYYLQSRYYDPVIGRFINADGYASTGQDFLGMNMFAYCGNNPVNNVDPSGRSFASAFVDFLEETISAIVETVVEAYKEQEMQSYLSALADLESGGQPNDGYDVVNPYGFMGRYQLGHVALDDIDWYDSAGYTTAANAYGVYSDETFLGNKLAQEAAVRLSILRNWGYAKSFDLTDYIGSTVRGVVVTPSGIIGATHLVGIGNMLDFFDLSKDEPKDGNGVYASRYMELLGGFDIVEWD